MTRIARAAFLSFLALPAAAQAPIEPIPEPCTPGTELACNTDFPVQLFEPAMGEDTLLSVESFGVLSHLNFDVALWAHHMRGPLSVLLDQDMPPDGEFETRKRLVEDYTELDVMAAVGLLDRFQVGLQVPVTLRQTGPFFERTDRGGAGVGDLRVQLKALLIAPEADEDGLGLAFSPIVTVPAAGGAAFRGETNVSFRPRAVVGYRLGALTLAANAGYLFRQNTRLFVGDREARTGVSDQIVYGGGFHFAYTDRVALIGELLGRTGLSTDKDQAPGEADGGLRVEVAPFVYLTAGGGAGVLSALGSPRWRAFFAVRWAPDYVDTDGDGLYDRDDRCPSEPEDKDDFADSDGCPDPDNDQDQVPDALDKCPLAPEDRDTFEDADGCPDPDNDQDGLPDIQDECPFDKGPPQARGCPPEKKDTDGDGISDAADKCPDEVEDKDGFEDDDGCPDPDNDGDGVPDDFDDCKDEPEDADGFQDDDGCPDPDNDQDGVLDAVDRCPAEKEVVNGIQDDDGCPDSGEAKVVVQGDQIVILEKIQFKTGKADIQKVSFPILEQVASVLRTRTDIVLLRIEGHTDDRGNDAKNLRLSQARADSVKRWLVTRGEIGPGRLEAVGYGETRPLADNRTREGRDANRRVEFHIVK